ncbi:hypothetical protein FANTH_9742 [Fusarium anthophilum]|uniref:Uncharacterized protein n=1 Tax=Fusarium anthophilum TaxID=48485 RepID=A0A8H5DY02_9HYPO|nr:hypothetical protein FANTH_9742 [Fusarium anthophilum]
MAPRKPPKNNYDLTLKDFKIKIDLTKNTDAATANVTRVLNNFNEIKKHIPDIAKDMLFHFLKTEDWVTHENRPSPHGPDADLHPTVFFLYLLLPPSCLVSS